MIATELTNAVEKASAGQPTPYAAINSAANQLLDDTATRSLVLRAQTRVAVEQLLSGAISSAIERRASGSRSTVLASVGNLLLGTTPITRCNSSARPTELETAAGPRDKSRAAVCELVSSAAAARRREIGTQVMGMCSTVPGVLNLRRVSARNAALTAISHCYQGRSGGSTQQRQAEVSVVLADMLVSVSNAAHSHERRVRAEMLVAVENATGAIVSCHARVGGGGPELRQQVADMLVQQVGLLAIQRKAGEAWRDSDAAIGADTAGAARLALGQPPEWMQDTRVRTPEQRLPPITGSGGGSPGGGRLGSPPLGASPIIGSPSMATSDAAQLGDKIRCELLQVEQLSGRERAIPIKPAASLLSGTRKVPHSRISPFTGFYKSWQYELQDSPNKFDKRRQFEHMHHAVKYCGSRRALPSIPAVVPPWEEDGADMSLQKVTVSKLGKSPGKTWDASKVHGMQPGTEEELQPAVERHLPVLGVQQHGRELAHRGM